jgi:hypothetical protein
MPDKRVCGNAAKTVWRCGFGIGESIFGLISDSAYF